MELETSSANYMEQRSTFLSLEVLYVLNCLIFFFLYLREIFWNFLFMHDIQH
jgi:hypothetical protein